MDPFRSRTLTTIIFILISAGLWHLLDGYSYRALFSIIPLLFAIQLMLSDSIEELLIRHTGYRSRWFPILIAPGTILHEMCHLAAAMLTGCTITHVALFKPNPQTGVLGYVSYTQPKDKWLVLRQFIIGFAPFFGCGTMLLLFNQYAGGDLMNLISTRPIMNPEQALEYARTLVESVTQTLLAVNLKSMWVPILVYLQVCFTAGAAPSGQDLRGAFSSPFKNITSAVYFTALAALTILLSEKTYALLGYEQAIADAIGITLRFTATILLLTLALQAMVIPLAQMMSALQKIAGIAKTIPLTSALITGHYLSQTQDAKTTILASAIIFTLTAFALIKTESKGKTLRKALR
jgi:hypothetical protein